MPRRTPLPLLRDDQLVTAARTVAALAHHGQTDKSGRDYLAHPARVAARLAGDSPETVAVGWLHDVVEDSDVTLAMLVDAGFPPEVIAGVDAMTRRGGESHRDAVLRAAGHPLARKVKQADVADNADPDRLAQLDQVTRVRLQRKYATAASLLRHPSTVTS